MAQRDGDGDRDRNAEKYIHGEGWNNTVDGWIDEGRCKEIR